LQQALPSLHRELRKAVLQGPLAAQHPGPGQV
jgi:hypothetical protein